jgi:hypothetical protein
MHTDSTLSNSGLIRSERSLVWNYFLRSHAAPWIIPVAITNIENVRAIAVLVATPRPKLARWVSIIADALKAIAAVVSRIATVSARVVVSVQRRSGTHCAAENCRQGNHHEPDDRFRAAHRGPWGRYVEEHSVLEHYW